MIGDPPSPVGYIGQSVRRQEDPRFLTGDGVFLADLRLPGILDVAIVRSSHAHARISGIETDRAWLDGVVAVYTARDLAGKVDLFPPALHRTPAALQRTVAPIVKEHRMGVLANDRVMRVGEPIAAVVAINAGVAADAAALVKVNYDLLPHLLDVDAALAIGAPVLYEEFGDNRQASFRISTGNVAAALDQARHRFAERFVLHRQVGSPLETRGVVASLQRDKGQERLVVWSATQMQHLLRSVLASMLSMSVDELRVICPDMGGSFGGGIYNEDVLIPAIARDLRRPARWIESRMENLTNTRHGRDQIHTVDVGFDEGGRIVALRDDFVVDVGTQNFFGVILGYNTASHVRGQYDIPNFESECTYVVTNKTPNSPVRGAGRMEAAFVMDRIVDMVADRLAVNSADVRRRNLISKQHVPYDTGIVYRDGQPFIYDSADFPAQLEMALEAIGYNEFRQQQAEYRTHGRSLGIGLASYIEASGYGPHEGAIVRVEATGRVVVSSGANPHGQGHETTLAQVCADVLGVELDRVTVRTGDTDLIPFGAGTFASRSAVTAGTAVFQAASKVRAKALVIASHMLGVSSENLVFINGQIHPVGAPERSLDLGVLAAAAAPGTSPATLPAGTEFGLQAQEYFVPSAVTVASGTHAAIVEVDRDTGLVQILRYVVVHDCGKALNPKIVEGQMQGGVVHGIGSALLEEAHYDDRGRVLSNSFSDYQLPTADILKSVVILHQECPSPLNPLGVKGCGEGGAVGPAPAVANAVCDALRPLHVRITEVPLSPERLLRSLESARHHETEVAN